MSREINGNSVCIDCPNEPICTSGTCDKKEKEKEFDALKELSKRLPNPFEEHLKVIFDEIKNVLVKKNKDYGSSFEDSLREWGNPYFLSRIQDKLTRLKTLEKKGKAEVSNESFNDTICDIIGYCALYLESKKAY